METNPLTGLHLTFTVYPLVNMTPSVKCEMEINALWCRGRHACVPQGCKEQQTIYIAKPFWIQGQRRRYCPHQTVCTARSQ